MKRLALTLVIVILTISSVIVFAQEEERKYPIDQWLEECIDKDPSTAGMNNCTYKANEMWDKELNKIYKQLMKKLNPQGQKLLKEAETAWIKYRDAELNFGDEIIYGIGGTIASTTSAGQRYDFVKTRTLELKAYLEMLGE